MKFGIFIFVLLGSALAFPGKDLSEKEFEEKYHELFDTPEDEAKAAAELAKEEQEIDYENELYDEGKANFKEAIHEWDDMDSKEFADEKFGFNAEKQPEKRFYGLIEDPIKQNTPEELERLDEIYSAIDKQYLPASYDSRAYGYVTKAKAQASCGSCAAFATGGAMEICLRKAGAPSLESLDISEQQLVDCGYGQNGANGCHGAALSSYPRYIAGKQISHEYGYPYANSQPKLQCQYKPYWNPGAKIDEAIVDYQCSDTKIMQLIYAYGSAVVALYAGDKGWRDYDPGAGHGVFDTCSYPYNKANHAVLAIGWGTSAYGIPYWIVKNSWGEGFGDKGFIKIRRGTCGIGVDGGCVALSCSANGQAQVPPPAPVTPPQSSCDVHSIYGEITGNYNLRYTDGTGKSYDAQVTCAHGTCSPNNTNIPNACMYICGKQKCNK